MHRIFPLDCISVTVFPSILHIIQAIAASLSLSPSTHIVIHCICYMLWCSGFQLWALRPAALPISIPAF